MKKIIFVIISILWSFVLLSDYIITIEFNIKDKNKLIKYDNLFNNCLYSYHYYEKNKIISTFILKNNITTFNNELNKVNYIKIIISTPIITFTPTITKIKDTI